MVDIQFKGVFFCGILVSFWVMNEKLSKDDEKPVCNLRVRLIFVFLDSEHYDWIYNGVLFSCLSGMVLW